MTAHADLDLREAFELSKLSRLASAAGDIKTMSKAYIHQRDITTRTPESLQGALTKSSG